MKYLFKPFLIITVLISLFYCKKIPQQPDYSKAITESRRMLDSLITDGKVPGIDAAIAIDGKIVWSEAFGYADLEHMIPVINGKTRFRIGSISKPLTSAAIGKLINKGKIDLDEPIQKYVPYFPVKKYPITVRQVAGHLAGIRHYQGEEFLSMKPYESVREGVNIFLDDTLLFEPGSQFSYSSYGFNLVSAVVEGASGEDFLKFMKREVFEPLDMKSTCADENHKIINNRTSFYNYDSLEGLINAPYVDNSYKWAGGGFISTTSDLIKFANAHSKPGFLSEQTLQEIITTQTTFDGNTTNYGIGWMDYYEPNAFGHGGGSVGGITVFYIYRDINLVIVLLSNSSNTDYGTVPKRIKQIFGESLTKNKN